MDPPYPGRSTFHAISVWGKANSHRPHTGCPSCSDPSAPPPTYRHGPPLPPPPPPYHPNGVNWTVLPPAAHFPRNPMFRCAYTVPGYRCFGKELDALETQCNSKSDSKRTKGKPCKSKTVPMADGLLPMCRQHRHVEVRGIPCQAKIEDTGKTCGRLVKLELPYFPLCADHLSGSIFPCGFLKLPTEIRCLIYSFLIPQGLLGCDQLEWVDEIWNFYSLSLVCRQISSEVVSLLYNTVNFLVRLDHTGIYLGGMGLSKWVDGTIKESFFAGDFPFYALRRVTVDISHRLQLQVLTVHSELPRGQLELYELENTARLCAKILAKANNLHEFSLRITMKCPRCTVGQLPPPPPHILPPPPLPGPPGPPPPPGAMGPHPPLNVTCKHYMRPELVLNSMKILTGPLRTVRAAKAYLHDPVAEVPQPRNRPNPHLQAACGYQTIIGDRIEIQYSQHRAYTYHLPRIIGETVILDDSFEEFRHFKKNFEALICSDEPPLPPEEDSTLLATFDTFNFFNLQCQKLMATSIDRQFVVENLHAARIARVRNDMEALIAAKEALTVRWKAFKRSDLARYEKRYEIADSAMRSLNGIEPSEPQEVWEFYDNVGP